MTEKYYLGLDMGTSSLGWAIANEKYQLLRKKGKDLWGVRLFDEAKTAADRRSHRTSRRRLQREKIRIGYLQDMFAEEINKIDPGFFQRLQDSKYYEEDKQEHQRFALFAEKGYTDREYYKEYPTIFHLRKNLLNLDGEDKKYDVRLVYLAVLNMYKHRGHFLNSNLDDNGGNLSDFMPILETMMSDSLNVNLKHVDNEKVESILVSKDVSNSLRVEQLLELFDLQKNKNKVETEVLKMVCGLKGTLSKIFTGETFDENQKKLSVSFKDSNYDEIIIEIEEILSEDAFELLMIMKQIHDWAVLANIMQDEEYLSVARVNIYDKHKRDLQLLKALLKENSMDKYNKMFRIMDDNNYSAYVGSVNSKEGTVRRGKKHDVTEIFKKIEEAVNECDDSQTKKYILDELEKGTFLPKQITAKNGIIPNQVHKKELKKILENAGKYLTFLNEKDSTGYTVSEKIVKLFEFCIPYYVGPLFNDGKNNSFAWSVRKEDGIVLPWNFEEKIDVKKSAEKFIENLVSHCTYINGERVLPKNSLLYEKFMVLNELNNLKINGTKINIQLKQNIYNDLFKRGKKVTAKMLVNYLRNNGIIEANEEVDISGIDRDFTNKLANYKKFLEIFEVEILTYEQEKIAEDIIFYSTVYGDSKKFLAERIEEKYGDKLDKRQIKRILGLKFKDWGNLSKELLELKGVDKQTGEVMSVISKMWESNYNLMELIATDKFSYQFEIEQKAKKIEKTLYDIEYTDLNGLYISAPVKRMVWQTILLLKECTKVMGKAPDKIFVEMARDGNAEKKRTESRKKKFLDLYKSCRKESRDWKKELDNTEESKFRSKKLYLYYTQKGKCMYSGEDINLKDLIDDNLYDIDHIYPRHFVKDDSIENNLVLVKKQINNEDKGDRFPIDQKIRNKMNIWWKELRNGGFITEEKYKRLTRNDGFTDEERAGFISRQIVETRQGTKVITNLFEQTFPQSEIIYVKAGNVSDFRHKFNLVKCREVNDFHHAQDAYLNIVVGNVYHTKFTKSPINFVKAYDKNPEKYKYHMDKLFEYPVSRDGENAWITKKSESITMVKGMMKKNTPLVTMMNYESHGGIADQTIYSAEEAKNAKGKGYLPIKSTDEHLKDTCKYGGMKKYTGTYFFLVEHTKKGKRIRTLEAMPLYLKEKLNNREKIEQYCENNLGYEQPKVRFDRIKMYSLIKVDGFYLYLTGRTGKQLLVSNAVQLFLDKDMYEYVGKIIKANERYKDDTDFERNENVNAEKNLDLYKVLKDKHRNQIYKNRPNPVGMKLEKGEEKFICLSIKNQIYVLRQILQLSQRGNQGADLIEIGETKKTGVSLVSKEVTKRQEFKLINQSVTGLYENEIDLLTV